LDPDPVHVHGSGVWGNRYRCDWFAEVRCVAVDDTVIWDLAAKWMGGFKWWSQRLIMEVAAVVKSGRPVIIEAGTRVAGLRLGDPRANALWCTRCHKPAKS
jgi:hypothetical protein